MKRFVLIHYHEINLKKNNRGKFENHLRRHVEALLNDIPHGGITRFSGRMFIALEPESRPAEIERRLRTVPGIANFAIAWEAPADLDAIRPILAELLEGKEFRSFKINARRGTKDFPLDSQQVNIQLGNFVRLLTQADVRMENPDLTCHVEFVGAKAYLYFEKTSGAGGLPASSGGRVLCLLSGGIDSPVAAFRLLRRGCEAVFVHFHSFPHTTIESQEKVRQIVRLLSHYQINSRLYFVPFAELQREIVAYSPPRLRVLLYRRYMMRIAEALATREKAIALVTGDNLGQVASQTLENLRVVSAVTQLPVLRPLIGDDKEDIIRSARALGTYDISILPDQDCCAMFVPKHPETMARLEQMEEAEKALDSSRLITAALESTTRETILTSFPRLQASLA